MSTAQYNYDVRIKQDADIFKNGTLSQSFINCGEMIITSKTFTEYDECEKCLSNLMAALSFIEAKLSTRGHVIVTKLNPIIDTDAKVDDTWDKHTLLKAYIADAELLKQANLNFNVFGQIRVNQIILGLKPVETE